MPSLVDGDCIIDADYLQNFILFSNERKNINYLKVYFLSVTIKIRYCCRATSCSSLLKYGSVAEQRLTHRLLRLYFTFASLAEMLN